ncbi:MAG: hypothetical protein IBX60_07330 [Candidatus Aminicenantes bacterium]|nr:hypothetical protein [Candidatus Aminicenantes bacterium]
MSKKTKRGIIGFVLLVIVFANLYLAVSVAVVNASIKDIACNSVGCPNGSRPCADVTAGPVKYYCYESPPKK